MELSIMKRSNQTALALASASVLLLTCGGIAPAQGQAIVVHATGPSAWSFPVGKRLPAAATITLRAGDIITVLDKVSTRILSGSGTFRLDSAIVRDNGVISQLSRALKNSAILRTGAVRGIAPADVVQDPVLTTIWLADIDEGGKVCVPKNSNLYLWRRDSSTRRSERLGKAVGGGVVQLQWPMGSAVVVWPTNTVPMQGGHFYRLTDVTKLPKSVDIELVALNSAVLPKDAVGLGALLFDNGCQAQFDALAARLNVSSAARAGG